MALRGALGEDRGEEAGRGRGLRAEAPDPAGLRDRREEGRGRGAGGGGQADRLPSPPPGRTAPGEERRLETPEAPAWGSRRGPPRLRGRPSIPAPPRPRHAHRHALHPGLATPPTQPRPPSIPAEAGGSCPCLSARMQGWLVEGVQPDTSRWRRMAGGDSPGDRSCETAEDRGRLPRPLPARTRWALLQRPLLPGARGAGSADRGAPQPAPPTRPPSETPPPRNRIPGMSGSRLESKYCGLGVRETQLRLFLISQNKNKNLCRHR
ncbi:unnamed protein product [Nyctereutes procyonoides]|uniref:(raccoon dog) hypothetical protein n=1 Tax=Nyctereutes procyonoides TaxID=34880 RepID=A0A811Z6Z5_NYCPR|nr:unnamed protein product [Nyctereutes procyonoides]